MDPLHINLLTKNLLQNAVFLYLIILICAHIRQLWIQLFEYGDYQKFSLQY